MILARLTRAIREQNWFAVVLEFVIVVAGVLLAFQISQLAERRAERAYARDALARIENEVRIIMSVRDMVRPRLETQLQGLIEARPIITGNVEADTLTPQQCAAIANSNQMHAAPDEIPSLHEMVDSGALASIDNPALRQAVTDFASKQATVRDWIRQQAVEIDDLTELFPDLIWFVLVEAPEDDDGWNRRSVCDLEAMRNSRAFRAHLMRNYAMVRSSESFVYDFLDEAFNDLHTAIDAELGIIHEEEETGE
ncbi:hypothetical protein V0U79_06110 [Hyphobacterium sp. HN65]|uniref:Secreted protein n=1 Tax=Hyphobacterium lacteum TaxID=3116575 RepID=A0ABU7LPU7_9PROT|nr:hypothetical protein [Hyphobacterium sp. HN65]MEE2525933.1 hypothetical protein [Hyphobacterium sp. HN65]